MALEDEFREWEARVVAIVRGHQLRLRCPVRQRDLLDAPEERIRQALLHFFLNVAESVPFELGAERERHDIDLRWLTSPEFKPTLPPLLIVETKVDHVAGDLTNAQLARYLAESASDCGVVFTGRRMWKLTVSVSGIRSIVPLPSLASLAELVAERAKRDPMEHSRADFLAASSGQIDALRRLVARYPYATFVLLLRSHQVGCRHLRISEDEIQYRPAICYTQHPTKIRRQDFERLVRLEG